MIAPLAPTSTHRRITVKLRVMVRVRAGAGVMVRVRAGAGVTAGVTAGVRAGGLGLGFECPQHSEHETVVDPHMLHAMDICSLLIYHAALSRSTNHRGTCHVVHSQVSSRQGQGGQ